MADEVGIYDANFRQLFASVRPLKATVSPSAKLFEHPLETGSTVTDHLIVNPDTVEIAAVLEPDEYRSAYAAVRQAFRKGQVFVVQTKAGTYPNMVFQAIPHEESPEMFDTISIVLKMTEVRFVTADYAPLPARKVSNKTQASTKPRGQQSASTAPKAATGSLLTKILGAF